MRIPALVARRVAVWSPLALAAVVVLLAGCAAPPDVGSAPGITSGSGMTSGPPAVQSAFASPSAGSISTSASGEVASSPSSSPALPPESSPTTSVSTTAPTTPAGVAFGTAAAPIQVQVTGLVLADDAGAVVMCPPFPIAGVGSTSKEIPTPDCRRPIPVTGVDLELVADVGHNSTHRWGQTHIVASWNGTDLTVHSQRLPQDTDRDPGQVLLSDVPCPAPAGGWTTGGVQDDQAIGRIPAVVGADFGALAMGYPHGGPTDTDGTNPSYGLQDTEQVLVVGVTGDVARARAAIRKVFQRNLCVVRTTVTGAEVDRQNKRILAALGSGSDWSRLGVMSFGIGQRPLGTSVSNVQVVVDSPALEKLLSSVGGPPIVLDAWMKPVR